MAKRKKKHQKERVLEPLVEPGRPIEVPDKIPAITPSRVASFINTGKPSFREDLMSEAWFPGIDRSDTPPTR
jgi:hypothetical protein